MSHMKYYYLCKMELIKVSLSFGTVLYLMIIVQGYLIPNYCCLRCGTRQVMCKYKQTGPGENCTNFKRARLSIKEKEVTLKLLNFIKNEGALGKYDELDSYARNMRKLEWDGELEMMAVRWAEQCAGINVVDNCRDTIQYKVSQVVHYVGGANETIPEIVRSAFRHQQCLFTRLRYHIENYCQPNLGFPGYNVKNYAQLLWYENYKVGCALEETDTYSQLICNFAPGGISVNQEVALFSRVETQLCDSCPNNTACFAPYLGLCTSVASTLYSKYFTTFIIIYAVLCYLSFVKSLTDC